MPESPYICASTAKNQYKLSESDLSRLQCKLVPNPHYRCAAPMRLYLRVDVLEALDYKRAHPDVVAATQSAQKVNKARVAQDWWASLESPRPLQAGTSSAQWCAWELVLLRLVDTVETGHDLVVRHITVVCADLCRVAKTCRDLRLASQRALHTLAQHCRAVPPSLHAVMLHPQDVSLLGLREAARFLGTVVSGSKAVVAQGIYARLGCGKPTPVPPALLLEVQASKATRCPPQLASAARRAGWLEASEYDTLHKFYAGLSARFGSRAELMRAVATVDEQNRAAAVAVQQRLCALVDGRCQCGNLPSMVCGYCARCCQGPCKRHACTRA